MMHLKQLQYILTYKSTPLLWFDFMWQAWAHLVDPLFFDIAFRQFLRPKQQCQTSGDDRTSLFIFFNCIIVHSKKWIPWQKPSFFFQNSTQSLVSVCNSLHWSHSSKLFWGRNNITILELITFLKVFLLKVVTEDHFQERQKLPYLDHDINHLGRNIEMVKRHTIIYYIICYIISISLLLYAIF